MGRGGRGGGEMMFVSDQRFLFKRNTKEQQIFLFDKLLKIFYAKSFSK
jgi:hypothetical protein